MTHSSHKSAFLKADKIAFKTHCADSAETTVSPRQLPTRCKYLCQDLIRQIGRPGWRGRKRWKKTLLRISYEVVLNCLVSSAFRLHPRTAVTLAGGLGYADRLSASTPSLFRQSLDSSSPQQEGGWYLQGFTYAVWNSKQDLTAERFAGDSSLPGSCLPPCPVSPHSFCPTPDLSPFSFPVSASLSLLHIISPQHLPDLEKKNDYSVALTDAHTDTQALSLEGLFRMMISSPPEIE